MTRPYYLAYYEGRLQKTTYSPAQTRQIRDLATQGLSRDAIAETTHIGYSSLGYVAALEHLDWPGWEKEA